MASRSWNRVELMGNLTRDPELRFTPNGAAVCTFGMATNRSYMVEGERKEEVDFHRLVAWNKLAELCNQLLKKGARVFISGRLQYREWEGQDGQKRRDTEIVVEDMIVLTPKSGSYSEEIGSTESVEAAFGSAPISEKVPDQAKETDASSDDQGGTTSGSDESAEQKPAKKPQEEVPADDLPF